MGNCKHVDKKKKQYETDCEQNASKKYNSLNLTSFYVQ